MQLYTVEYSSHESQNLKEIIYGPIYLVAHVDLRLGSLTLEGASVSHILDRNACIKYIFINWTIMCVYIT